MADWKADFERHRSRGGARARGSERRSSARESDDSPEEVDRYLAELDDELLSTEEREYVESRRRAEERVELYLEAGKRALLTVVLLIFVPPLGFVLGLIWGIRYGHRYFESILEPRLRKRMLGENDEVGERVRRRVERDRRTLEGEHSRSLEQLSASIAHEIRNPITAAKSLVQQMEEDPMAPENPEYARVALDELRRVERSVSHLLRYARDEEPEFVDLRMADVLDSALETFRDRSARSRVAIAREFDCEGCLRGDPEKLRRVFINLVGNAFDALEELGGDDGRIDVSMGENLAGTEIWVRVRDNGAGMAPETREQAFDPFVTAKPGGTGLGLAIVKKILEAHGDEIEVESEPGRGTEFILTFSKQRDGVGGSA